MQIQRWQSVMLLIAAAVMACFTFCTVCQIATPTETLSLSSLGYHYEGIPTDGAPSGWFQHTWYFFILSLLCIAFPLTAIFLYKNLKLQKRVTAVSILFAMADFCVAVILGSNVIENGEASFNYSVMSAPVIAAIALWLAWCYISRDQKLLASVDRIR